MCSHHTARVAFVQVAVVLGGSCLGSVVLSSSGLRGSCPRGSCLYGSCSSGYSQDTTLFITSDKNYLLLLDLMKPFTTTT